MRAFILFSSVFFMLVNTAIAHMQLTYPAPFNASNNEHRTSAADPYLQYPYVSYSSDYGRLDQS
jgi:hypothetical protein